MCREGKVKEPGRCGTVGVTRCEGGVVQCVTQCTKAGHLPYSAL
jgi:hypothetical protein